MMAERSHVPIPNTEVKLSSADGSWDVPVRIGHVKQNLSRFDLGFVFIFYRML